MLTGSFAHDSGIIAWITVVAYMATAVLCMMAARRAAAARALRARMTVGERPFWLGMVAIFLFLGLNKQLDLQTTFTQLLRASARAEGWYADRRVYQAAFVAVLAACAVSAVFILLWMVRSGPGSVKLAVVGGIISTAFILLRAASFHHVDAVLSSRWGLLRWNWIIELTGIAIVAFAASIYRPRQPRPPPRARSKK